MSKWQRYGKAVVSLLFFVWTIIAPLVSGDGHIDTDEWVIIGVGAANGLLVYIIPLNPAWEAGKTVINGVLAALAAAQTVMLDGLQPEDWTIIIGAFLAIVIGWFAPTLSGKGTDSVVRVTSGFNA
jgi:hypothetical protein